MTTLVLITSHAPSLVYFRAPLIRSLQARGIQVLALAPNFDDRSRAAMQALGATPIDCPMARTGMNPLLDAVNTWRMARLLRRLKPDASLGYFIKLVIFGTLAAWWAGVPHRFAMVEGLGFVFTDTGTKRSLKRRLLRRLVLRLYKLGLSRAERVIFLNPDDRDELVAAGVVSLDKTFLLGGIGVDLAQWAPAAPPSDPVTFLLVARLLREKASSNMQRQRASSNSSTRLRALFCWAAWTTTRGLSHGQRCRPGWLTAFWNGMSMYQYSPGWRRPAYMCCRLTVKACRSVLRRPWRWAGP